jgi:chemotaxis protein MotB
MASDEKPLAPIIYVIKKNKGHGGHHGGAWKVAYADFVTAMMALFIVLWLLNTSTAVKQAVGGYFQDPTGHTKQAGSGMSGSGDSIDLKKSEMNQLKDRIQAAVKQMAQFKKSKDQLQMSVTGEGLRIEMIETDKGMFFERGKGTPTEIGRAMLTTLATEVGKLPNRVLIEGHTDANAFSAVDGYGNWELSSDRANSARRIMQDTGLRSGQVQQVRGFADQDLRNPKDPNDASNRRVSIIVKYDVPVLKEEDPKEAKGKEGAKPEPVKTASK